MANLRAAGRAMEAHPFERLPTAQKSAPADWGKQFKRVGSQAAMYVYTLVYRSSGGLMA